LSAGKTTKKALVTLVKFSQREGTMIFLEQLKLVVELITATVTVIILVKHLFERCRFPIKNFFKITVPLFFKGKKNLMGKTVRFFKALKLQREETANILKAIAPDHELEDVLVLDTKAFFDFISKSDIVRKIPQRKR
jgi:hypothetical protein